MGVRTHRLAVMVLIVSTASLVAAQDAPVKPDPEYKTVQGLDNWTYQYDVSTLKPGTYNIIARAVDSAGNVSFAAPFNLTVDPESDLPVAGIVNPLPLARVGADLNVVGTCVDDDSVAHVELRLDDGEWQRAQGADYWSYYLPTSGLPDGLHAIAVRGVDSNGLEGRETKVSFHLDRTKPLHDVSAPAFGSIVSGRLSVTGTVYDANGLAGVSYSMDSGQTWQALRHAYDKKTNTASFSLAADTRKLPDGPAVLWLKSVDGVGSEGVAVFLYFVDNTKPELAVLSPAEGEAVNGRYEIRGRVYDKVGVRSLSWTYEKQSGQVELLPGNPYFSLPFEAPPKAGTSTVRILVVDVAGNESTVSVTRQVDPRADLPVVTLSLPVSGSTLEGDVRVVGLARDDDGVAFVDWKLDSGAETRIEAAGAFSFTVSGASSGSRTLSVRAVDVNGLAGPWVALPFTYSGAAPKVTIDRAADASGERGFAPGTSVSTLEGKAALYGAVSAANPLTALTYTVNGGAPMSLPFSRTPGGSTFAVPLSASLPFGVLDVTVTATDAFGKSGSARVPVLAVNYDRPRSGPSLDFGLTAEPAPDAPATVAITESAPLVGTFVTPFDGEGIRSVRLEPGTELAAAAFDGAVVRVTRSGDGATEPTLVVVETERGHRFAAGPFIFRTDSTAPSLTIAEPAFGSWRRGETAIVVRAEDGDAVASVEYSVNGGAWSPLAAEGAEYRAALNASGLSGPVRLDVKAVDIAGNTKTATTAFMADAAAPETARLLPRDGDPVAGPTLFVARTGESMQSIERVELGRAGSFEPLPADAVISFVADPSAGPLVLRTADKAGNVTELDLLSGLNVAEQAMAPPEPLASLKSNADRIPSGLEGPRAVFAGSDASGQLSWTVPMMSGSGGADAAESFFADYAAGPVRASGAATLTATFTGVSPDPKKPVAAWGYAPGATDQPLALKKGLGPDVWTASLKLPAGPDGAASVWITIQDAAGGSVVTMLALDYDSAPPAIELVAPATAAGKAASPGPFLLAVRATDARGIASVSYEAGADKDDFKQIGRAHV